MAAANILGSPIPHYDGDQNTIINDLQEALFASKIVSYTQGYMLTRAASEEFGWNLACGNVQCLGFL